MKWRRGRAFSRRCSRATLAERTCGSPPNCGTPIIAPNTFAPRLEKSLRDLRLDYLDLYLIHFPISSKFVPFDERYPPGWFTDPEASNPRVESDPVPIIETWRAMEQLVRDGLVREIGVCNFGTSLLRDLMSQAEIGPAMLQVEMHPYLTQEKLTRFCHESGIGVTAFSPLGAQSYFQLNMAEAKESLLEHETVKQVARRTRDPLPRFCCAGAYSEERRSSPKRQTFRG